jgi:pimeloyl-ACP methyl ester carboxylesterase
MNRYYIRIQDDIHLHYRSAGSGTPIVLLHPSPRSSKIFEPFGELLAPHFQVIMPDLFGYGQSDSLPIPINNLYDYLPFLKQTFDKLGLTKFALYGSATGAQLAIAYAKTYPNDVSTLFLDNAAEFSEEQRSEILSNYFVDATPKADGSHLENLWEHIKKSLYYFPWYSEKEDDKIRNSPLPENVEAEICNDILRDYLQNGNHYADAYKAAFEHEKVENILQLRVPTTIFRWEGSSILKYIDQLLVHSFPENIKVVEISAANRYAEMIGVIKKYLT